MTSSIELPDESAPVGLAAKPALSLSDRMQRGDVMAADCPSRQVLQHLTSRWGVLVLITLLQGTQRFSQLRRKIGGINERMLAQTLQWLEADAMVRRRSFNTVPPHVEYTLTPLGAEAAEKVRDLVDWLETHMPAIAEAGQAERPAVTSDKAA
ncbi:HxlR family transcriptional regulator [Pigmentiphaga litoralis]|uniref:winged helix-turn-helix transcriptional regulator n=1 Tax=Pigmentiphaga litoralis TaxID=516702 RepID=UPI001674EC58|nr:helix-turn-helix domain-containing protein [Pigmentiphaga litoralis]GGX37196.1 HxlR family transcriptional regulator [Pigmentiphaga litoralis]